MWYGDLPPSIESNRRYSRAPLGGVPEPPSLTIDKSPLHSSTRDRFVSVIAFSDNVAEQCSVLWLLCFRNNNADPAKAGVVAGLRLPAQLKLNRSVRSLIAGLFDGT